MPLKVKVPEPTFVKDAAPPEIAPFKVNWLLPPTALSLASAIVPVTAPAFTASLLIIAPPLLMPVPLIVKLLAIVLPLRSSTAPLAEIVKPPRPNGPVAGDATLLEPALSTPTSTVVVPV